MRRENQQGFMNFEFRSAVQQRQDEWSGVFDRFAHSYLVWALVVVIVGFWLFNLRTVLADYDAREEQFLRGHQEAVLDKKHEEIEAVFRSIYQHLRTISLIPAIRSVPGGNRHDARESAVREGRLSVDTDQTVRQIFVNLSRNVQLSEIYTVLDGFRPDQGEVPLLMYDAHSDEEEADAIDGDGTDERAEDESSEYAHYVRQLDWLRLRFPKWTFTENIDGIPAIMSPLLPTCDNTQYTATEGEVRDTYGLLYSVPVYGSQDGRFKGLVTAILRANVIEAMLVGVPLIPVTASDRAKAAAQGWEMPQAPSGLAVTHDEHDIEIFDRRNAAFSQGVEAARSHLPGRWAAMDVRVRTDGTMRLHHYLAPAEIDALVAPLRQERNGAVGARLALLVVLMLVFFRAIRDQRRHHAELVRLALYDSLTSLPNRRLFVQRLDQSIARARRHGKRAGLMSLDIDNFGAINDTLGHQTGDALLAAVAMRLRETLRISDEVGLRGLRDSGTSLARLGGDDFTLILDELEHPESGVLVAERIMAAFREPLILGGQKVELSLSAGLTVFPDDADDSAGLMICADHALRQASAAGTGHYRMFNDEMRRKAERQTRLTREVALAVRAQQFSLAYQPKLDLRSGDVVSFEALLRWQHAELGFVSPVEFVPLLERSGQIVEVGRWILLTACRQLLAWQADGRPGLRMNVNVSARQLLLSDVVGTVREVLAETGVAPPTLTLEITESMVIDNLQEGQGALERLRALGVRIAIDDFGTGYSSLTYLQRLPVDCLKLDKSMIDTVLDPKGGHVVRATIGLAHGLGLEVVAEGVEHEAQRDALAAMDCDVMQGYFLSRPLTDRDATAFLERHPVAEALEGA